MGLMGSSREAEKAVLPCCANSSASKQIFLYQFFPPSTAIRYMKGMAYADATLNGFLKSQATGVAPAFRLASPETAPRTPQYPQPTEQPNQEQNVVQRRFGAQGEPPIIAGVLMEFIKKGGSAALLRQGRRVQASVIWKQAQMSSLSVWDEVKQAVY